MGKTMITLLNTSIITAYGSYEYKEICEETAKTLITHLPFQSAIGHGSTAEFLTEKFGVDIQANRIEFKQEVSDIALVFKLNGRAPEGVILTKDTIKEMGYSFGILFRTK
jgi:hypothetical protein